MSQHDNNKNLNIFNKNIFLVKNDYLTFGSMIQWARPLHFLSFLFSEISANVTSVIKSFDGNFSKSIFQISCDFSKAVCC